VEPGCVLGQVVAIERRSETWSKALTSLRLVWQIRLVPARRLRARFAW
jgi:hypothetical protein